MHPAEVFGFFDRWSLTHEKGLQLLSIEQSGNGCIKEVEFSENVGDVELHVDFLARVYEGLGLFPGRTAL